MATIEEAKAAVKANLRKYKKITPIRIAYLGDGLGTAASNVFVVDEPSYLWARESKDAGKPFKVLNRQTNLNVKFNLPIRIGYPEDQPNIEQILGISFGGISITQSGTSAIGGTGAHHTQHEWGGGDEVYIDQRQFLPGLAKPTVPASMRIEINRFHHFAGGGWLMFDGAKTESMTPYLPGANYRYVLVCLNPATNSLTYQIGAEFAPDVSIDSIIASKSKTTFKYIPPPPADEIPLAAVLLQPTTTQVNWNINGVNNLAPMRLLFGTPEKDMIDRVDRIETYFNLGNGAIPTLGAGSTAPNDFLPPLIDGRRHKYIVQTNDTAGVVNPLLVGELAFDGANDVLYVGSASGNVAIAAGAGGGDHFNSLSGLTQDVNMEPGSALAMGDMISYTSAANWNRTRDINLNTGAFNDYVTIENELNVGGGYFDLDIATGYFTIDFGLNEIPLQFSDYNGNGDLLRIGGPSGVNNYVEFNPDGLADPIFFFRDDSGNKLLTVDSGGASTVTIGDEVDTNKTPLYVNGRLFIRRDGTGYQTTVVNQNTNTTNENGVITSFNTHTTGAGATQRNLGQIRSTFHVHNDATRSATMDFRTVQNAAYYTHMSLSRIEGTSALTVEINPDGNDSGFFFYDASGRPVIKALGTNDGTSSLALGSEAVDGTEVNIWGRTAIKRKQSGGTPHMLVLCNQDTTEENGAVLGFNTKTTGAGAAEDQSMNLIYSKFHVHNHATRSATMHFRTIQNGANRVHMSLSRISNSSTITVELNPDGTDTDLRVYGTGPGTDGDEPLLRVDANVRQVSLGAGSSELRTLNGVIIGAPTGSYKGTGTINASGDIYRDNTAYGNPDYTVEHYFTGDIVEHADKPGAKEYQGLLPLDQLAMFMKTTNHLPGRPPGPLGIFDRADWVQEKIEEQAIYITQLHDRISSLEKKLNRLIRDKD